VADRIAQMVAKQTLEPKLEPYFHEGKRFSNYTQRTTPLQDVNYTSKLDQTDV
jgi:hypothetical protein